MLKEDVVLLKKPLPVGRGFAEYVRLKRKADVRQHVEGAGTKKKASPRSCRMPIEFVFHFRG